MEDFVGSIANGRYSYAILLAEGGMAGVYLASDGELGKQVAIKVFKESPGYVPFWERELEVVPRLTGLDIVPSLLDHGVKDGVSYLIFDFVNGDNLNQILLSSPSLARQKAVEWVVKILDGLDRVHAKGVIHCDLKPENLILGNGQMIHFVDWGSARYLEKDGIFGEGNISPLLGGFTPAFASPERLLKNPLTRASDIWSMGVVLYKLFTAGFPFGNWGTYEGMAGEIMRYCSGRRSIPSVCGSAPGDLHHGLDAVIAKAMAREPQSRYQTAGEMAKALRKL